VLLAIVLATATSGWIALVVGADRGSWTSVTWVLVAGLGLLTLLALLALGAVVAEGRRLPRSEPAEPAASDGLADVTILAGRVSRRLGPFEPIASRFVRVVDTKAWAWVRRRPITAAVVAAAGVAALFAVGALREGYSPPLLALVLVVAWSGMFVLIVPTGSYLGIVRSPARIDGTQRRLLDAALVGTGAVPIALAFRDSLWWLVGSSIEGASLADLELLIAIVAASAAGLTFVIETVGHVHDGRSWAR
jgi:hypothetical protein